MILIGQFLTDFILEEEIINRPFFSSLNLVLINDWGPLFRSNWFILQGHLSDIHGKREVLSYVLLSTSITYFISSLSVHSFILLSICRVVAGIFKHTQDLSRLVSVSVNISRLYI